MAVTETDRINQEIASLEAQRNYPAQPGQSVQQWGKYIDSAIAQKRQQLADVQSKERAQTQQAGGNPVTTERVKGDAFGMGSQLVNTIGYNQEAYDSKAFDPLRQKAREQEIAAGDRAGKQISVDAARGTAAQIATGPQDQARNMQMELGSDLLAASRGQGPSVAGMQYQRNMEDAMAQQMSMAASSRGNPGIAMRNAAMNQAGISQRGALDSAMIRAQEQQAAQNQLAGLSSNIRGQDIGLATDQAGLSQQMEMMNVGNQQQSNMAGAQLSQANEQFYRTLEAQFVAAGMSAEQAAIAAKQRLTELGADLFVRQEGMKQGLEMNASQNLTNFGTTIAGGVIGGAATVAGAAMGRGGAPAGK